MLPEISIFFVNKICRFNEILQDTKIKGVRYIKGSKIKIDSAVPIPVELDGDFKERYSEVNIRIIPKSLPLIVNFYKKNKKQEVADSKK